MNTLILEDLLNEVKKYDKKSVNLVKKAYYFADKLHDGQLRQSGEKYITHPLNVAYTLAKMKADADTVCAGLLHDVLEDTPTTSEEIIKEFNEEICMLVEGVTKINNVHFTKMEDIIFENTRRIITSLKTDVRIIIVKLADRLHNMQTLEFKTKPKQQKNAYETMEIFVPLAYLLGAYDIKEKLEDLSFKYINEKKYNEISNKKINLLESRNDEINEMIFKLKKHLKSKKVSVNIKVKTLNNYGIYKRMKKGFKFEEVHNIVSLIICPKTIKDCYVTLGLLHSLYLPVNHKFKDYICNPKTNMYRSLHMTVFGENENLVQVQIRTKTMDIIANNGVIAYWETNKNKACKLMQSDLTQNYQFFSDLLDLDEYIDDNEQFVGHVKDEVLNDKIYVYSPHGKIVELPKGSNPIDYAYKIHTDIGNHMVSAIVNDIPVDLDHKLKNKDRVKILTSDTDFDRNDWEKMAFTSYAKRRIRDFLKESRK